MALSNEQQQAVLMLHKVLETQPDVIKTPAPKSAGITAAIFCVEFIEAYANWLKKQGQ